MVMGQNLIVSGGLGVSGGVLNLGNGDVIIKTTSGDIILDPDGDDVVLLDNTGLTLGTGRDTRLYWDGTDFVTHISGSIRMKQQPGLTEYQEAWELKTTAGALTLNPAGDVVIASGRILLQDSVQLRFGTTADVVIRQRPTTTSANEIVSGLSEGTAVHQGASANSLFVSTLTDDSDIMMLVSDGGNSLEFLLADAAAAHLYLGHGMADVTVKTDSGDLNLAPAADVVMGTDVFIEHDTNATLTASTNQAQGQGALTTEINEIAVVGNPNDVVTMPIAAAGREVTIINNGANTLQIFPASGDDLGAGVDTATTLASGSNVVFVAYDDTNWEIV